MAVDIQFLGGIFQDLSNFDNPLYYDRKDDEVMFEGVDWDAMSDDEYEESEERYIALPDPFRINQYEIMKDFIYLQDDEPREWLLNAIHGKGAFRRFRGTVERFGLSNDWYQYKDKAYEKLAIEWCEEHGLLYEYTSHVNQVDENELDENAFLHSDFTVEEREMSEIQKVPFHIVKIDGMNYPRLSHLVSSYFKEIKKLNVYYEDEDLLRYIERASSVYAVSDQGRMIGYYRTHQEYVDEIYVIKDKRRQGVGKMLLEHCLEMNPSIQVMVQPTNTLGLTFLERQGFTEIKMYQIGKKD